MKTNFIDSFRNLLLGKTNTSLTTEDLYTSRYISLYVYHKRIRSYKAFLEKNTLDKTNDLLKTEFPERISKEAKKEIIDCVVIFMKFISVNYDYYPTDTKYTMEFDRIVRNNIEQFKNN